MSSPAAPTAPEFFVTKEYRRFAEFCDACRRYRYIGLCYGPPGVGKTLSARYYAGWDRVEPALELTWPYQPPPPEICECRTLFYTPPVANTPGQIARQIHSLQFRLRQAITNAQDAASGDPEFHPAPPGPDYAELLLVDEADRLKLAGIEQLRDTYDRGHLGLVLLGMPGLEKRLARYAQLYSRVGFVHPFRPLSAEELRSLLPRYWERWGQLLQPDDFTDTEAVAAILRITGGNFRLLHRLLTQIERVLQINERHTITAEVVEAARASLVIGAV